MAPAPPQAESGGLAPVLRCAMGGQQRDGPGRLSQAPADGTHGYGGAAGGTSLAIGTGGTLGQSSGLDQI